MNYKYKPESKPELVDYITTEIGLHGASADLNYINAALVSDMSYLFMGGGFNGDISRWDVGNVKSMRSMFSRAWFNGDIFGWDLKSLDEAGLDYFEKYRQEHISVYEKHLLIQDGVNADIKITNKCNIKL